MRGNKCLLCLVSSAYLQILNFTRLVSRVHGYCVHQTIFQSTQMSRRKVYLCLSDFFACTEVDDSALTSVYPCVANQGNPFVTCDTLTLIDPKSNSQVTYVSRQCRPNAGRTYWASSVQSRWQLNMTRRARMEFAVALSTQGKMLLSRRCSLLCACQHSDPLWASITSPQKEAASQPAINV